MAAAFKSNTFYAQKSQKMSKKQVLDRLDVSESEEETQSLGGESSEEDFQAEEPTVTAVKAVKGPAAKKRILVESKSAENNPKGKGKRKSRVSQPWGEQVIEYVKERPALWNPTTRGRKDKQYADIAWEELAKQILGLEGNFSQHISQHIEFLSKISQRCVEDHLLFILQRYIGGQLISGTSLDLRDAGYKAWKNIRDAYKRSKMKHAWSGMSLEEFRAIKSTYCYAPLLEFLDPVLIKRK